MTKEELEELEKLSAPMISVTYNELKTLRDNSQLIPGQQYRITDYVTTTAQENTRSAGHPFDVIVTADSENTLNEEARACIHEGDTYFSDAGAKLEAWKIWYCLDNDKARFSWSVAKTKKSISVDVEGMTPTAEYVGTYEYAATMFHRWDFFISGENGSFLTVSENPQVGDTTSVYGIIEQGILIPQPMLIVSVNEPSENEGFGVIYRMIDEQNNDVPYDFKNIQFIRKVTLGKLDLENGTDEFVFTFNSFDESVGRSSDLSLNRLLCVHNTIKEVAVGLNNIVFLNKSTSSFGCYSNTFETGCFNNTFGKDCYFNTFGENCSDNIFGDGCHSNTFGDVYYSNTFGNTCNSNTFGDGCYSNTFGNAYISNIFRDGCYSNTFGDHCKYNIFGDNCRDNTFGDHYYSNTFGCDCRDNTFGDECYSNTFGYNFSNNTFESGNYNIFGNCCVDNTFNNVNTCTFGNNFTRNIFEGYCRSNSFGNDCRSNSFGNNCNNNSFGNDCTGNSFRSSASETATLKSFCSYNHFDDGCSYNVIWNSDTTGAANALRNINVNRGVSGTSSNYNFINITTLNADYEIQVTKNSKGELKIYCEADLIA